MLRLHTNLPIVVDHTDDGGALLGPVANGLTKVATALQGVPVRANDYALVCSTPAGTRCKFPIVDEESTILSAAYLVKVAAELPGKARMEAARNLSAALSSYGIEVPEKLSVLTHAPVLEMPMTKRAEAALLYKQVLAAPPKIKRAFAQEALAKLGSVPEELEVYTGDQLGSDFRMHMRKRKERSSGEYARLYAELEKTASAYPPDEVAEALYEADQASGLIVLYGSSITDAYASVFANRLSKTAFASVVIGDRQYRAEEIIDGARQYADDLSGIAPGLAEELQARPLETLRALPDPHKAAISRIFDGK